MIGAAGCARSSGVPPLLIGLTIVGFGTSAPEMLVSSLAALQGEPGMSVGNALGSNITNVGLVLGIAAMVTPLRVHKKVMAVDAPVLFVVMAAASALMLDGELGRVDGALLLGGLVLMIAFVVRQGLKEGGEPEGMEDVPEDMTAGVAVGWLVVGLGVLLGGAKLLVDNAVAVALHFDVDTTIIGLTVIAFGTSLPELAATVVAARRNEHDIAIGNIIGSNMFNMLGVLGLPGLIHPNAFPDEVMTRDTPVMLGLLFLFWLLAIMPTKGKVSRAGGLLLCCAFAAYMGLVARDVMRQRQAPDAPAEAVALVLR